MIIDVYFIEITNNLLFLIFFFFSFQNRYCIIALGYDERFNFFDFYHLVSSDSLN